jgi:hypothetical protein
MFCRRMTMLALAAVLAMACDDFVDAATAIAYDIEREAGKFARSGAERTTMVHVPASTSAGCKDDYRMQFSSNSAIVIWCRAPGSTTETVSSHSTTYHLRFVEVPETTILDKERGESIAIDLVRGSGKPVVAAVR